MRRRNHLTLKVDETQVHIYFVFPSVRAWHNSPLLRSVLVISCVTEGSFSGTEARGTDWWVKKSELTEEPRSREKLLIITPCIGVSNRVVTCNSFFLSFSYQLAQWSGKQGFQEIGCGERQREIRGLWLIKSKVSCEWSVGGSDGTVMWQTIFSLGEKNPGRTSWLAMREREREASSWTFWLHLPTGKWVFTLIGPIPPVPISVNTFELFSPITRD